MRLIEAISKIRELAWVRGEPAPTIYLPLAYVHQLAAMIEKDLGGRLYRGNELLIMYDGVTFDGYYGDRPRVRVRAGRRVISMAEYFWLGEQWRPGEVDAINQVRRALNYRSAPINRIPVGRDWMG